LLVFLSWMILPSALRHSSILWGVSLMICSSYVLGSTIPVSCMIQCLLLHTWSSRNSCLLDEYSNWPVWPKIRALQSRVARQPGELWIFSSPIFDLWSVFLSLACTAWSHSERTDMTEIYTTLQNHLAFAGIMKTKLNLPLNGQIKRPCTLTYWVFPVQIHSTILH
jgi:hypothetical protein